MERRDVAICFLYNEKAQLLMQHRSSSSKRYPNKWGIFGGGIESDESPEEAVRRELKEELEYDLFEPELIFIQEFHNELGESGKKYLFIERYSGQPLKQHEGQGLGWFSSKEIELLDTIPHDGKAVATAVEAIRHK